MGVVSLDDDTLEASLATTLDVLAWEVELAAARCIQLDSVVGQMMNLLPIEQQTDFVDSMHMVDLLSQQLTSLSAFARRMSECVPGEFSATVQTALGDITLGALADRMRTALGGEEKGINDRDEAGDLDLF
jgi:hypothetical protein